jgi:hypothetical protein
MKPSLFHAVGLEKYPFGYTMNVTYFSKIRAKGLEHLKRLLPSLPSFVYAYGSTETNLQKIFRDSLNKTYSHYHLLVNAGDNFEMELVEKCKGSVYRNERKHLVKLKDNSSITGYRDTHIITEYLKIVTRSSEFFLEKTVDISCSAHYTFKASDKGVNSFFINNDAYENI